MTTIYVPEGETLHGWPETLIACGCGLGALQPRAEGRRVMWWCAICRRLYRLERRFGRLEQS